MRNANEIILVNDAIVTDTRLSSTEFRVFCYLLIKEGKRITHREMGAAVNIKSKDTLLKALNRLRSLGLVSWHNEEYRGNVYKVVNQ